MSTNGLSTTDWLESRKKLSYWWWFRRIWGAGFLLFFALFFYESLQSPPSLTNLIGATGGAAFAALGFAFPIAVVPWAYRRANEMFTPIPVPTSVTGAAIMDARGQIVAMIRTEADVASPQIKTLVNAYLDRATRSSGWVHYMFKGLSEPAQERTVELSGTWGELALDFFNSPSAYQSQAFENCLQLLTERTFLEYGLPTGATRSKKSGDAVVVRGSLKSVVKHFQEFSKSGSFLDMPSGELSAVAGTIIANWVTSPEGISQRYSDETETASPQPEAGWYPDPSNVQQMRLWDGTRWTDQVAPLQ
jgi:hypothetical protein